MPQWHRPAPLLTLGDTVQRNDLGIDALALVLVAVAVLAMFYVGIIASGSDPLHLVPIRSY